MITLLLLVGCLLFNVALTVLFLWMGARIVRATRPTIWRALLATFAIYALSIVIALALAWLGNRVHPDHAVFVSLLALVCMVAQLAVFILIIRSARSA